MQGHDATDIIRVRSVLEAGEDDDTQPEAQGQTSKQVQNHRATQNGNLKQQQSSQEKKPTQGMKQNGQSASSSTHRSAAAETSFGHTLAEKAWLKRKCGDDFKFLRAYEMKIQRCQDRLEGRTCPGFHEG